MALIGYRSQVHIREPAAVAAGASLALLGAAAPGVPRASFLVLLAVLTTATAAANVRQVSASARLVLGVVAVAVGIGIGLNFTVRSGPPLPATVGWVALLAGLLLLGSAVRGFVRAVPGWWRLLLVPAALIGLVAVWALFPAFVASAPPPTPLGSATPADRGLPYTTVSIRASDGVRLSAWYVPSSNGAAIVLLHGSGANRTATLGQATVLARHGFGVLLLDARGHGSSGGRAMDFGWYGDRDVSGAVGWLLRRPDVQDGRIAVLGLSMGGEEAIGAAGGDPRIRAVVAEGATGRSAADKASWLPGGLTGALQRGIDRVTYGVTDLLTDVSTPTTLRKAAARAAPRPILLIAAGNRPDEAHAAEAIQRAAPTSVRIWVVPGADHTKGLATRPAEWESTVVTFLTGALHLS